MNCVNFRVRSKKYKKFCYCIKKREEITFYDCNNCSLCKYKKQKKMKITPIKRKSNYSSKRAKATNISQDVKSKVWERDSHKCILCNQPVPKTCANAHYIKRSQGGLGIPENVVCLCPECHSNEDNGLNTKLYERKIETYLKGIYGENWDVTKLIYKKY